MIKNIKWYIFRLKAMSIEEIWQRNRAFLIKKYIKNRSFKKVFLPEFKTVKMIGGNRPYYL